MLGALTALNGLNYLDRYVAAGTLPLILAGLAISDAQGGLLQSLFIVAYSLVCPVAGWLGDRQPRLRLAALGVFVWSAATVASGLAPTYALLLVARAVIGAGEASYSVVTPSLLSDCYPAERRARALGIFYAAIPVGSALGYILGGVVGEAYGWRATFFIAGAPGAALAFLLLLLAEPRRGALDGAASAPVSLALGDSLRSLARRRSYVVNTAAQVIYTFAMGGLATWMPTYFVRVRGIPLASAASTFGVLLVVAGFLGTLLGGRVASGVARRWPGADFVVSGWSLTASIGFTLVAVLAPRPARRRLRRLGLVPHGVDRLHARRGPGAAARRLLARDVRHALPPLRQYRPPQRRDGQRPARRASRPRLRGDDDAHAPARRRRLAVAHRRGLRRGRPRDAGARDRLCPRRRRPGAALGPRDPRERPQARRGGRAMTGSTALWAVRLGLVVVGLAGWFWTQRLIARRAWPEHGIGDAMHLWTAALNRSLRARPATANALLIATSAVIDGLGLFLLASAIFGPTIRPFLGLLIVYVLRQVSQGLCSLPQPDGMIWRLASAIFGPTIRPFLGLLIVYVLRQVSQGLCSLPQPDGMIWRRPGFPSLLVTYGTAGDLFFSGHTAIAVYGCVELVRLGGPVLPALGVAIASVEALTVLVLRAHYTMDVLAAIVAALWAADVASAAAPAVDRALAALVGG